MDNLLQDLRFAVRSWRRQPAFVAVALATLALGIGTATAMFTVINGVLLKPLPFHDPGALTMIRIEGQGGGLFPLPDADFLAIRANHRAFAHVAVYAPSAFNITGSGTPDVLRGAWVSGEFFTTLGVRPIAGRFFTNADDAPGAPSVVVLSHAFWTRQFGADPKVLGQTIRLDEMPCTIVGIGPRGLEFPRRDLDLWRNLTFETPKRRGPFYLTGIARLQSDAPAAAAAARANLEAVAASVKQQYGPGEWAFQMVSMTDALVGEVRTPLYLLLTAVGFLLLIAIVNVANLLLSRSAARQRELAVRLALGAQRARITRQLVTESALLSLAGGALGVLLGVGLIEVLLPLGQTIIPRLSEIEMDWRVLAFGVCVSLAAGLLFGAAPALHAWRGDVADPLRDGQRTGTSRSRRRIQRTLVVAEIALALVLSVGAGLLVRSLIRLQHVELGFRPERLLTFQLALPQTRYPNETASRAFYQRLLERLEATPGVESAAVAVSLPPDQVTVTDNFTAEGQHYAVGQSAPVGTLIVASDSYFRTLGIPLLRGRFFDERDGPGGEKVVIVSRTLAERYYPNGDAVGRRFRNGGPERPDNEWMRVVGIVGDVKYDGLAAAPEPAFYWPFQQHPWSDQFVVVRTAIEPEAIIAAAREAVWSLDREQPLALLRTMDDLRAEASAESAFRTYLLGSFGALGLLLALVGVYGVMSYAVSQRAHEMGVRAALGARPRDLVALVLGDAARLAAVGIGIGIAGALALTSLTTNLLFGVTPRDP
ncbi:MAG TPA: ABC transporter permease, partial [Vicinamibacterales bacterium]|nr:ABC transporter permease [Vicinamibacterales bacterium]